MKIASLKKGQLVVKILSVMGIETASIEQVESVKRGIVSLRRSTLKFAAAHPHREHDAAGLPGCSCHLVPFDAGEEERWSLLPCDGQVKP